MCFTIKSPPQKRNVIGKIILYYFKIYYFEYTNISR